MGWLKKTIVIFCAPLVFFLLLEGIFRLVHFEYYPVDTGLFVPSEYKMYQLSRDGEYYTSERGDKFLAQKPQNEIRIFVLGGSSVQMLGNCLYLQRDLEKVLPGKTINIVNAGYAAWGTNRLLLLFKEILEHEPDLIFFYEGHNEFEEEIMRDIFHAESRLTQLNNRLLNLSRFYQFYSMLVRKSMVSVTQKNIDAIHKKEHPLFPHAVTGVSSDAVFNKDQVYNNYKYNVTQMIKLAKNHKVPLIISTLAYNRLIPPHKPPNDSYRQCGRFLQLNQFDELKKCLETALDEDMQPHRASETSNRIIKELAALYDVPLADVDKRIVEHSDKGIPGPNMFTDYCHLVPRGRYLLLKEVFRVIQENSLLK